MYRIRYNKFNRDYDVFRVVDDHEEYVGSRESYSAACALELQLRAGQYAD